MPVRWQSLEEAEAPPRSELVTTVATSAPLSKAPALRRLLLYLWDQRDNPISEYAIALDVLGKRADFDPKTDASVRVHISRLRHKLKEYFEGEGASLDQMLVIPQGGHQIQCVIRPARPAVSTGVSLLRRWWLHAAAIALLLALLAVWFRYERARFDLAQANRNLQLPEIWRGILKPGRVTRVIYPLPVFYVWNDLRVRDVLNNDPGGWAASPRLAPFVERFGPPHVSQSYTVASDTHAALQLTRFLSSHATPIETTPTANLSLDQYGSDHLIFLGIPPTNEALDQYLDQTNFHLLKGNGAVYNRAPRPGELREFRPPPAQTASTQQEKYGIVAVLPGYSPGASLMLLMGLQTSALASYMTSPFSVDELSRHWREAGRPAHFEVVVHTVADGPVTKLAETAAFRPLGK